MRTVLRIARSRTVRWLPAALGIAAAVEVGLRVTTLPRLCRVLGVRLQLAPDARPLEPGTSAWRRDPRYRAATLVLHYWPWSRARKCLRHALVTGCLLRRRHPRLHLGVAHTGKTTVAHAWLSIDGVVIQDPTVGEYTPLRGRPGR